MVSSFSHEEFVNILDHYEGDIHKVKNLLEQKEFNLLTLINGKF